MRLAAVKIATMLCAAFYRVCTHLKHHRRIVFIARLDEVPLDFTLMHDYFCRAEPSWKIVILAKSIHNPLLYIPELLKQIYYCATSSAVVLERTCLAVCLLTHRIEAPVIQMWHSLGNLKRFGYTALNTEEGKSTEVARLFHMHEGYDGIAISSMSFAREFAASFNVSPSILFEAPLPRVDVLIDAQYRARQRGALTATHPRLGARTNILYCPTFRKNPRDVDRAALAQLVDAIDFERYNLIYKPHPSSTLTADDSRVITIRASAMEALCVADVVISDYSTIIYEAGLMKLPVALYTYDWESYEGRRGLTLDVTRDIPVPCAENARDLIGLLERDVLGNERFDYSEFQAFVHRNVALPQHVSCTQHMCECILGFIKDENSV